MRGLQRVMAGVLVSCTAAMAQEAAPPEPPKTIIRTEKKLVLVDVVATDKKDNYIRDLTAKDFRVFEDRDEQTIETFSFEADPAAAQRAQKHYLVLFFDNSSMAIGEQAQARQAALRFLDKNTGANRFTAVVNFGGSLKIAQNFTGDVERLKQVVSGVKIPAVTTTDAAGSPSLSKAATDFSVRNVLLGLRTLAKSLGTVPGRKTLIFLSAGFRLDPELHSDLTAVIDVCNKANVAIYPIDVRGLVAVAPGQGLNLRPSLDRPVLMNASYAPAPPPPAPAGGNRGGTASPGSGVRGGSSNAPRSPMGMGTNNPMNQQRSIIPRMPDVTSQQDVLFALASGTGGFVIVNTNDLLGGLERIANEQNEYYVLGYSPVDSTDDGSCHELKVKVDRGGTKLRFRTGYCSVKPLDALAGSAKGRDLENRAEGSAPGTVTASILTAYFYTAPNTAKVNVALEMPTAPLKFEKEKGKLKSELNVLGIAYDAQGAVAAKFSDTLKLEFQNKKEVEEFEEKPLHYDTQFDLASGKYDLKVVFSASGEGFGKLQMALVVDPYDNKKFNLSTVAMSKDIQKLSSLDAGLDAALLEDKTPLVSMGMKMTPSGTSNFHKTDTAAVYLEIYEPLLEQGTPKIGIQMRVIDRKTGQQQIDTGLMSAANYVHAGNPVIPVGLRLPLDKLAAGSYRAEFRAADEAGNNSVVRTADFEVQ